VRKREQLHSAISAFDSSPHSSFPASCARHRAAGPCYSLRGCMASPRWEEVSAGSERDLSNRAPTRPRWKPVHPPGAAAAARNRAAEWKRGLVRIALVEAELQCRVFVRVAAALGSATEFTVHPAAPRTGAAHPLLPCSPPSPRPRPCTRWRTYLLVSPAKTNRLTGAPDGAERTRKQTHTHAERKGEEGCTARSLLGLREVVAWLREHCELGPPGA
jgi:hypothetical protein